MATAELRLMEDGEQEAFARSAAIPFLMPGEDDAVRHWTDHLEVGRSWLAVDRGRIVGNCCNFSRDITLPAAPGEPCPTAAMTAVSGVGVHPSHRRQGLLGRMMSAMLDDGRRRREAFACLLASESVIYGRFGFGCATSTWSGHIDSRRAAFRPDLEPPAIDIQLLDADEATKVLPALHDRCRARRHGDVSRSAASWRDVWADPPSRRNGGSASMFAVAEHGYASYRATTTGGPDRLLVREVYGTDTDVEAALVRFLASVDLIERIDFAMRPVDDPLRWRLADPRQLETVEVTDFLWVRILDVPAALTGRYWPFEARMVLDVKAVGAVPADDPAVGRWALDASPQGGACTPAGPGDTTDLSMGVAELGALHLGGVTPRALAAAGRIIEERSGALAVADLLWPTPLLPFTATGF